MQSLVLRRPDDFHVHVRDDQALATVVPHTARQFRRALIMPNLKPPVTTTSAALAYAKRIADHVPVGLHFTPLMSLYLTDTLSLDEIAKAKAAGVRALKLYPAGVTTNSDAGVTRIENIYPVLAAMQQEGLLLLVHGEVTDANIDIFDREAVFIERVLEPLRQRFPALKVVLEHITTQQAVEYVLAGNENLAATVTAHHLLFNRNAIFKGGLQPHYYCLPVLKREEHRQALGRAIASGHPRFFLGTDSAPHAAQLKEQSSGCAGCYTAYSALELYAEAFEAFDCLDKLENFASMNGARFYGLPLNEGTLTLQKLPWIVPDHFPYGHAKLKPLKAGEALHWQCV